jgi:gamma-glutamyltranspeptidase/glutathione hydrolase
MRLSSPFFRAPVLLLWGWCWLLPDAALAEPALFSPRDRIHPVFARNGMVVTQEALASEIGLDILKQGGNAVDAAVAVGFALAVTLPQAGNLGGGGFMLTYNAHTRQTEAIDFRETAPAAAGRDLYLNDRVMWMKRGFATAIRRPACRARWPD